MQSVLRVFTFAGQVSRLVRQNPTILNPVWINVALTVPLSLAMSIVGTMVSTRLEAHIVMGAGVVLLYFLDYYCNAMTVSLVYDQVTYGESTLGRAFSRTSRSVMGIALFAAISGAFDLLASYASSRRDVAARAISRILHAVWTTAVYVVLPAMVIERTGFVKAFSRSKALAKNDPTQVGAGIIALGLMNWVVGAACMAIAYEGAPLVAKVHPLLGGVFFYTFFNIYWAVSGFIKSTYFTCFYLWARRCEEEGSSDTNLAPAPLANALAA